MTDQGNGHEQVIAGTEPPNGGVPAVADDPVTDRAPPRAAEGGGQCDSSASLPAPTADGDAQPRSAETYPTGPGVAVQVERVLLGVERQAPEPFVLPPPGIIPFVLGNKYVFRRFVISTVVLAIAIVAIAIGLKIAGIQLDSVITVAVTGATTATGIVARAYFKARGAKQVAAPDASPDSSTQS